MASNSVLPSFPIFNDVDGNPLESGYIYVGNAGFNPESSPKTVYWDEALTTPAVQPIRTIGGYPQRSGSPAMFYTDGDFSITVRNKNSSLIYSVLNRTYAIDFDVYGSSVSEISRAIYTENTSGVANTLTLARPDATIPDVTAYYDGMTVMFENTITNTGAVTATVAGLASKKVRTSADADLVAGDIYANVFYTLVYNTALDSGAGAFELKDTTSTLSKLWNPKTVTHDMASDADYTLSTAQNAYGRIEITDTGVLLTAARNIVTDNNIREFRAINSTAQTLTFKTSAGTGVALLAGAEQKLYCDGTDIVSAGDIVESGTNANGSYIKLSDGTLICRFVNRAVSVTTTTAAGSVFRDAGTALTFPLAFLAGTTPDVTPLSEYVSGAIAWSAGQNVSNTGITVYSLSYVNSAVAHPGYHAIGRWK